MENSLWHSLFQNRVLFYAGTSSSKSGSGGGDAKEKRKGLFVSVKGKHLKIDKMLISKSYY